MAYKVQIAETVRMPYIIIAAALVLLAVAVSFANLPAITATRAFRPGSEDDPILKRSIWTYRHTVLAALGIFVYVGVEVGLAGFMVGYFGLPGVGGLSFAEASKLTTFYWGGALVGRLLGAWIMTKFNAGKLLGIFGLAAVLCILVSMNTSGQVAIWSLILCGFFNSVMFPNIFTLGVAGLGPMTSKGSGLIMTAVWGGALIPVFIGWLVDNTNYQWALVVPVLCYLYIAFYGFVGHKPTRTLAS
jgi:FHS family L-fucose permease-like MFS transporter